MRAAILTIDKSSSADSNPVIVGQEITFTIKVSNTGNDDATDVIVTDNVPLGFCVTGLTDPSGVDTTYANGTITWDVGTLDNGTSQTFTFKAIPSVAGNIKNTASVTGKDQDGKTITASDTTEFTVLPSADLSIYKYACTKQAVMGDTLTYFVVVVNYGPSTATGVTVEDTFTNATIQSLLPSQGSCPPGPYGNAATCTLGDILPEKTAYIKVTATPTTAGTVENTAIVSSPVSDPDATNNKAIQDVTVQAAADIGVTKSVTPPCTAIGEQISYKIIATNYGPSPATSVTIEDTLPNGFIVDAGSVQPPCTLNLAGTKVTCTITNLGVGASETINITGTAPAAPGVYTNTAAVTEVNPPDLNPSNNTATASICVGSVESANLSIVKKHSPEPVLICTPLTYTITVTNQGPAVATGVTVIDQLPPSVDVLSVHASQGECCYPWKGCCPPAKDCCSPASSCSSSGNQHGSSQNGWPFCDPCASVANECEKPNQVCQSVREIVCQLGSLAPIAPNNSAVIEIVVRPKAAGVLTNTAMVTANQIDADPTDNYANNTTQVITPVEQIDLLIQTINNLVTAGTLKRQDADLLIADLTRAKWAIECGAIRDAQSALNCFLQRIKYLIHQKAITREVGCSLAKPVEQIREYLNCPCNL